MDKQTKSVSLFSLINLFLLTIATLLITIFIFRYNEITPTGNDEANSTIQNKVVVSDRTNTEKVNNNVVESVEPIINKSSNEKTTSSFNMKYYYDQLNEESKLIYDSVEGNLENMKTGTYSIKLPKKVSRVDDMDRLNEYFQSALDALAMDKPEVFYLDVSKINLTIKTTTYGADVNRQLTISPVDGQNYLEEGYPNKDAIDIAYNKAKDVANTVVANAYGDTYGQVRYVHDWLIDNVQYDGSLGDNAYNIYGALVEKKAVCEGYAEAFKFIMDKLGIPCILVSGIATNSIGETENHEWNEVQIDGKWYAVDVTWDDPILINGGRLNNYNRYRYFLKGSDTINSNHVLNGRFSSTGKEFTFPELTRNDYFY